MSARSTLAGAALAALGALGAGCPRVDAPEPLAIRCTIEPSPPRVGPVTVRLELADERAAPVEGARVTVEANMSHAGMTPVLADAAERGGGRYDATFELTMGGDWYLWIEAELADGRVRAGKVDVPGVAAR